MSVIELL